MEELDGDVVRLSSRGRYAERDIVQVSSEKYLCVCEENLQNTKYLHIHFPPFGPHLLLCDAQLTNFFGRPK